MNKDALQKAVANTEKKMYKAAENLDFTEAARLRDELAVLEEMLKKQ